MNNEQIQILKEQIAQQLAQTKSVEERLELADKLAEQYPEMTLKEAMEIGFSYPEMVYG